ncbi:MAG: ATP-binding protein [Bifidobacteriaceae bacterium]|jgi:signal transduction histidine kinase|nr:ATP-binding protein [Bifidobacteriaceae bacterium]
MASPPRDYRVTLIGAGVATLAFFMLVSFSQIVTFTVWGQTAGAVTGVSWESVGALAATFVAGCLVVVCFGLLHGERWSLQWRALSLIVLALVASALRLGALRLLWGGEVIGARAGGEMINGLVAPLLALVVGLYFVDSTESARHVERVAAARQLETQRLITDLEGEEMRVRRDVSQTLHGHIQQRLVFIASQLQGVEASDRARGAVAQADTLAAMIEELDNLREQEVRQLSHSVYPGGVDIGLHQAFQLQLAHIPATVAVDLEVSPEAARVDTVLAPEFDEADRLILVTALQEGVTNALKHGGATRLTVALGVRPGRGSRTEELVVEVRDNGTGVADPAHVTLSGLAQVRARLESRGGGLELVGGAADAGTTLRFWLPRPAAG